MREFLHGHWERIFNRTLITRDYFVRFSSILEQTGRLIPLRAVSLEEQLMIFLFVVGHGASNSNFQETWQRSGSAISKYFGHVLEAFYNMSAEYIRAPDMNNVHHTIQYNNRFYPYFQVENKIAQLMLFMCTILYDMENFILMLVLQLGMCRCYRRHSRFGLHRWCVSG